MIPVIAQQQEIAKGEVDTRKLVALAIRGLPAMFDRNCSLFCNRVRHAGHGLVREGISWRYTIMTLLGLHEVVKSGETQPFDIEAVFASLTANTNWIRDVGDLGLLTWLVASVFPHHLARLYPMLDPNLALKRYSTKHRSTMELAWFLTGCASLAFVGNDDLRDTALAAKAAYQMLLENQGSSGAFGHQSSRSSIQGFLRGRVGTFADQVYPILALSHMAKAYGMDEPLKHASACADVICDAQGELGQWWWHYDSETGRVLSRYPVYSVHQHGMGPMALFALQEVSSRDYREPIYRGLRWIKNANELGCDLRDETVQLVWRCVRPTPKFLASIEDVARLSGLDLVEIGQRNLAILRECRPYELGWLLYAFTGREGQKLDFDHKLKGPKQAV